MAHSDQTMRKLYTLAARQIIVEMDIAIVEGPTPEIRRAAVKVKGGCAQLLALLEKDVPLQTTASSEAVEVWGRVSPAGREKVRQDYESSEPWRGAVTETEARDRWCADWSRADAYGKDLRWRMAHCPIWATYYEQIRADKQKA